MLTREISVYGIEHWLRETDDSKLQELWEEADRVRLATVGDDVHLRGLIEISNNCIRTCTYCGLRGPNKDVVRYRMGEDEILECAKQAKHLGYGTVVMQSGEDYGLKTDWLAGVIRRIKDEFGLAVTLSMGERPREDLKAWREAGADRYLIRFETSDPELYDIIHPPSRKPHWDNRFQTIDALRGMGYEVGGGVMVGIPGQTYASLARDIETFRNRDLDMIGVGPYIAHPETPLGAGEVGRVIAPEDQVPGDETTTCKVVALTRIVRPDSNIPRTTALAAISKEEGRKLGLLRGANVIMPNLTPPRYRELYEVYPGKACLHETSEEAEAGCLRVQLTEIGRKRGNGPGSRKH